jgi:DNA-directed RNA polymerase subunit H (RpoH/RPB5)
MKKFKAVASTSAKTLLKSRTTLLDNLCRQGYDTSEYDGATGIEVDAMHAETRLDMLVHHLHDERKTYAHYHTAKPLKEKYLQEVIQDLFLDEAEDTGRPIMLPTDTLVVITNTPKVNDTTLKVLSHIWEDQGVFVTVLSLQHLQFNVLDHVLVPPHVVLTKAETNAVSEAYNVGSPEEYPVISRFDPVAQAIGIRPGQVCKITRPSKTAVVATYYRICV